jgi:hypothetical protein
LHHNFATTLSCSCSCFEFFLHLLIICNMRPLKIVLLALLFQFVLWVHKCSFFAIKMIQCLQSSSFHYVFQRANLASTTQWTLWFYINIGCLFLWLVVWQKLWWLGESPVYNLVFTFPNHLVGILILIWAWN